MSRLVVRRLLQVVTGTLVGLAVLSVIYVGFPGTSPHRVNPDLNPVSADLDHSGGGVRSLAPTPVPPFSLRTSGGEPFDHRDLRGELSVVFFGFSNCPDVCPLTLGKLSRALEILGQRDRAFQGVFVSVDPARDTPSVLEAYMERFHPSLVALTGPEDEIVDLADAWDVHVRRVEPSEAPHGDHLGEDRMGEAGTRAEVSRPREGPDPSYAVEHSTRAFVVDPQGRVVASLAATLTANEIAEALALHLDGFEGDPDGP